MLVGSASAVPVLLPELVNVTSHSTKDFAHIIEDLEMGRLYYIIGVDTTVTTLITYLFERERLNSIG